MPTFVRFDHQLLKETPDGSAGTAAPDHLGYDWLPVSVRAAIHPPEPDVGIPEPQVEFISIQDADGQEVQLDEADGEELIQACIEEAGA